MLSYSVGPPVQLAASPDVMLSSHAKGSGLAPRAMKCVTSPGTWLTTAGTQKMGEPLLTRQPYTTAQRCQRTAIFSQRCVGALQGSLSCQQLCLAVPSCACVPVLITFMTCRCLRGTSCSGACASGCVWPAASASARRCASACAWAAGIATGVRSHPARVLGGCTMLLATFPSPQAIHAQA